MFVQKGLCTAMGAYCSDVLVFSYVAKHSHGQKVPDLVNGNEKPEEVCIGDAVEKLSMCKWHVQRTRGVSVCKEQLQE